MAKRKFLKKILPVTMALAITASMFSGTTVMAAEAPDGLGDLVVQEEEYDVEEVISNEIDAMSSNLGMLEFDTDMSSFIAELSGNNGIMLLSETYTPDKFESNDSFASATTGKSGRLIRANIHSETDMDYFKFEVTDADVSNGEYYSFILSNMPTNCDYGLLVVNENLEGYVFNNEGSAMENVMFSFNAAGTYYVIVYSASGCSNTNYALFLGRSIQSDYYGYESTGLTVNFGYIPQGNSYTTYTGYYAFDLTNETTIPDTAFVTKFRMTADGNGANWGGFIKQIFTEDGTGYQQQGGIELFNMPERGHIVRQCWYIRGGIVYSMNFSWTPRVHITYDYIINPQTMYYAPLG